MAANRLKMDAITLVAATQTKDEDLTKTILGRHDDTTDLIRAVADVAALLAGSGAARTAITGYLDYIGASNGHRKA